MKVIRINGIDYNVYGRNEKQDNTNPHMVEANTGLKPEGGQRKLLRLYLEQNGITTDDDVTTHICINKILQLEKSSEVVVSETAKVKEDKPAVVKNYLPITNDNIEKQHRLVEESANYGKEGLIIHDVLNAYPLNNDLNTVAMKIAIIDVTNSTHLSQYKSQLSLYDLAKVILETHNFDERLRNGDPELVNIIARNIGAVNMFSFASKYCTYHNVEIYQRDDYSIFDSVVKEALPNYVPGLTKHKIDTWRAEYKYSLFNDCIGKLLDGNNIHIPFRRRKFDHFLWYANR